MVSEKEKKCEKNRDADGEAGKRELSQSKIPSLAARLAQLPMGSQPLSSVACSPFALPKFPGGSISLMLSPGTPGCLMARNSWMSPLLPSLGPKILMLTVFSAIHSLEKKTQKNSTWINPETRTPSQERDLTPRVLLPLSNFLFDLEVK